MTLLEQVAKASETNMRDWYLRRILGAKGEVCRSRGVIWGYSSEPLALAGSDRIVPLPGNVPNQIQPMLRYFRERGISPWCTCGRLSTADSTRRELKAWGFEFVMAGICMAASLSYLNCLPKLPSGLHVGPVQASHLQDIKDHPSFGRMSEAKARNSAFSSMEMAHRFPRRVWNFGVFDGNILAATSMLLVANGVAGIYDVAVLPEYRGQDLGKTVVLAACSKAKEQKLSHAVLQNDASLIPFYEKLGFSTVSEIDHWQCPQHRIAGLRNTGKVSIAGEKLATAIVTGNVSGVQRILRKNPGLAREAAGGGITPLHLAAYHGVTPAVKLLLSAGADPELQDAEHQGTPLSWAIHGLSQGGPAFKRDQRGAIHALLDAGARLDSRLRKSLERIAPGVAMITADTSGDG